jgi:hypothetical protein
MSMRGADFARLQIRVTKRAVALSFDGTVIVILITPNSRRRQERLGAQPPSSSSGFAMNCLS